MIIAVVITLVLIGNGLLEVLGYAQPQPLGVAPRGVILKKLPPGMTQQQLQQRLIPAMARLKADARNQVQ